MNILYIFFVVFMYFWWTFWTLLMQFLQRYFVYFWYYLKHLFIPILFANLVKFVLTWCEILRFFSSHTSGEYNTGDKQKSPPSNSHFSDNFYILFDFSFELFVHSMSTIFWHFVHLLWEILGYHLWYFVLQIRCILLSLFPF